MRLLDTPQWNGLTDAEKRVVGRVYGNNGELATALSPGARKVVERLVAKGLVTAVWGERQVTVTLREAGWPQ
jgi:hypothetical protein